MSRDASPHRSTVTGLKPRCTLDEARAILAERDGIVVTRGGATVIEHRAWRKFIERCAADPVLRRMWQEVGT